MVFGEQSVSLFVVPFSKLHDDFLRLVGVFIPVVDLRTDEQPGDFRLGTQLFGERKLEVSLILWMGRGVWKQARGNGRHH